MALMPVADALSAILAGAEPLPEEMIALDAAYHRVLARDLPALRTQPPQAMSAMDGYAVRSADAAQAGAQFNVIGEVLNAEPALRNLAVDGTYVPRPATRLKTKFELGGERLGHAVFDLAYRRV